MNNQADPKSTDDDVPELTDEWFEKARPAAEALPASVMAAARRKPGRPRADVPMVLVTLRLSREVIEHFKAGGKGWQTRIDEALRKSIG
jgi:uncharacterized protein (DUF4415 family)